MIESRTGDAILGSNDFSYVDHERGSWFLVERQGELYLDARYSYSAAIDDSALIQLNATELESYQTGGHEYLSDLSRRIHNSAPYDQKSRFYTRDLYRGEGGTEHRRGVSGAVAEHTWAAEQRRRTR